MIVIEGLKDGPVEGMAIALVLDGNGDVYTEDLCKVGKWKALEPHERLIDADNLTSTILSCMDAEKQYSKSDFGLVKMVINHIIKAPTVLEATGEISGKQGRTSPNSEAGS